MSIFDIKYTDYVDYQEELEQDFLQLDDLSAIPDLELYYLMLKQEEEL